MFKLRSSGSIGQVSYDVGGHSLQAPVLPESEQVHVEVLWFGGTHAGGVVEPRLCLEVPDPL